MSLGASDCPVLRGGGSANPLEGFISVVGCGVIEACHPSPVFLGIYISSGAWPPSPEPLSWYLASEPMRSSPSVTTSSGISPWQLLLPGRRLG